MSMKALLTSSLCERFHVLHVDTADRRGIAHVDNPDLYDVWIFLKQLTQHLGVLIRKRPTLCYISISQSRLGFLRDSLFIIPALLAQSSIIIHLHGGGINTLYEQSGYAFKLLMNFILRRITKFIVLGDAFKTMFSPWATPEQIEVVPNGVPDDGSHVSYLERPCGKTEQPLRILFLSTLSRQKGLFVLLDSVALTLKEERHVKYWIAGPWWPEAAESEAQQMVLERGLSSVVHFVGPVNDKQKDEFLCLGDVFVFPGIQQEGQPLVVLEAMARGLPVIATDRGCLRETVVNGITGFIVPPNSPEAISEHVVYLARHPEARITMAGRARERFERLYSLERFASRMERVFLETLPVAIATKSFLPLRRNRTS